jgi:predicted kinase
MMATAHLIYGFLGSGKTTFAKQLERDLAAVRFTPDEWMAHLFGDDPPESIFQEKASAILDVMEPIWMRCLSLGLDVVLDFGFWRRAERDHVRERVEAVGAQARLYVLNCSDEEAWKRVDARNGSGHQSLYIAPATFRALKERVEPLGDDEPFVRF